ncbi:hypothetical protein VTI74DRAFT_8705 [Chaetomium olivicolor]
MLLPRTMYPFKVWTIVSNSTCHKILSIELTRRSSVKIHRPAPPSLLAGNTSKALADSLEILLASCLSLCLLVVALSVPIPPIFPPLHCLLSPLSFIFIPPIIVVITFQYRFLIHIVTLLVLPRTIAVVPFVIVFVPILTIATSIPFPLITRRTRTPSAVAPVFVA